MTYRINEITKQTKQKLSLYSSLVALCYRCLREQTVKKTITKQELRQIWDKKILYIVYKNKQINNSYIHKLQIKTKVYDSKKYIRASFPTSFNDVHVDSRATRLLWGRRWRKYTIVFFQIFQVKKLKNKLVLFSCYYTTRNIQRNSWISNCSAKKPGASVTGLCHHKRLPPGSSANHGLAKGPYTIFSPPLRSVWRDVFNRSGLNL